MAVWGSSCRWMKDEAAAYGASINAVNRAIREDDSVAGLKPIVTEPLRLPLSEIFNETVIPQIHGFVQLAYETGLANGITEGRRLQALEQAGGRVDE